MTFVTSADAPRVLRESGLERFSIRFPLNCPEATATAARLAVAGGGSGGGNVGGDGGVMIIRVGTLHF